jgi:predicted dehydrogenase
VHGGALGDIQYVDSVRVNLGLVQSDIDVVWDLAPHDLSILDFILPADCRPTAVSAHGSDPIGAGQACVAYLTLPLCNGALAHAHVNWLSPTKIRQFIIGGSKQMLVWDDLNPSQRITMYDTGVGVDAPSGVDERRRKLISYRTGDMVAPALAEGEALRGVVEEFTAAIRARRAPLTDGRSGLRVLELLTAASASMESRGTMINVGGGGTK